MQYLLEGLHFEFCRLRVYAQSFAPEMETLVAKHILPSALTSNKFAFAHILYFSNTFPCFAL